MEFVGLIAVLFTLLWLRFLFSAGRFMSKQREANRQIVAVLEGIESEKYLSKISSAQRHYAFDK